MVDRLFTDPWLATLHDGMCAGRADFDFYLPLVLGASSVLDASRSTLRLLDTDALDARLADAGLRVAGRYGDWGRQPSTPASPEIITVAVR